MIRMIFVLFLTFMTIKTFAAESDLYNFSWLDKDKEIYVLQNRKFKKQQRFFVSGGFGKTLSGAFVDSTSMQLRAGYFFSEELGAEFIYSSNSGEENDTAASVRNSNGGGSGSIPFRRIVNDYIGVMATWAPFYSKINTFNTILYVDWIFGLGFAKLNETNNGPEVRAGSPNPGLTIDESHTGLMWDVSTKFYINQSWSIRADINGILYQAAPARESGSESDQLYSNIDLTFAVQFDL
ncbi:outer membrane beta-barrel domain-containing protein [Halobacteriovorax sp. ZH4_bin.1]|uniref:outer membrane beta-barrel domain-containing protein n=2 Tax=Halobacteriovorax TaxID=1652133 RepID=UPI003724372B